MNHIKTLLTSLVAGVSLLAQTYEITEAGGKRKYRLATDEVYVQGRGAGLLKAKAGERPAGSAPVVYDLDEEPASAKAKNPEAQSRRTAAMRIVTAKILVKGEVPSTEKAKRSKSLMEGWTTLTYADAWQALAAMDRLQAAGVEYQPVLAKQLFKRQAPAYSGARQRAVNDPLFPRQWHLAEGNTGINLRAAWDFATGRGINMTVVDDGLEVAHEDLKDNTYPISSKLHLNFNGGSEDDPSPASSEDTHGTACAGLAAGRGFNELGTMGVAPEARMIGVRLIAEPAGDEAEAVAFAYQPEGTIVHVSSNSWGPSDDAKTIGKPADLVRAGMEVAATKNRDGLGTVLVISAGNGRAEGDDSSYDAYSSSRFAISVGAVNRKGEQSSYSESGMAVAISALGGESAPPEMIWTTNNMGAEALKALQTSQPTSQAPVNYTDAFNGTSAAAPQVSGAVALLLERYPRLSYRDVKEILMRSARRDVLLGGDAFVANGAGYQFSHSFGAGLLNVAGALELADSWRPLGPLQEIAGVARDVPKAIPDNDREGTSIEFQVGNDSRIRVETVEVTVDIQHGHRGDLGLIMTSPSGMKSIAQPRLTDDGKNLQFTFTSVRHWGETSTGTWKVQVIDVAKDDVGEVKAMSIKLYGTAL